MQELLEGFDGEASEGTRSAHAPLLAWLSGFTRKGKPEEEVDEETLRVRKGLSSPFAMLVTSNWYHVFLSPAANHKRLF